MFVEELAEPFLNVKSNSIEGLLSKSSGIEYFECSQEKNYLSAEQKNFINLQIIAFSKKLEGVHDAVVKEKGRQEDEIYEIYKKTSEMSPEKKEKYSQVSALFETVKTCGSLLKDFYNLELTTSGVDESQQDSALMNFIKKTTKEYSREKLVSFFEDEEEAAMYLDLLDPELIREASSTSVLLEAGDDKKRRSG